MNTQEVAEKSIKNAAGMAYFVGAASALFALLAWFDVVDLASPWSLVDGILFAVIGFFIGRGSKVAAVLGLLLYLAEVLERISSPHGGSVGTASAVMLFITLYLINGVRGGFALPRLRSAD